MKKIIEAQQGSPEWHKFRATSFGASEASAMLGISSYKTRSQLLKEKATGLVPEVDAAAQALFDRGHEYEAIARPWAEEIVGEDLYPVTLALDIDGITLSASMDGLTMLEDVGWEHKTMNSKLAASLSEGVIPDEYHPQLEQQMLVSGAEKILFMASSGNQDEMMFAWYEGNPELRQRIIGGWKQFAKDLADYQHKESAAEAVADPQEALPAVVVEVSGSLAITDNLDVFGKALTSFVDNLNLAPKTDQDFANLEAAAKALKKAEDALTSEEDRALAQADGIEALRRTVAQYRELARTTRLRAEKVVKAEKENRRNEIRIAAVESFRAHIDQINATLGGRVRLPEIAIDVAGAMKGKKTISSLEDAANTEVARAKIEANRVADEYRKNLAILDAEAKGYEFLFHDTADLVTINPEHLPGVIRGRIAEYKEEEQRKLEAERERIRREEEDKARREAEAKAELEREEKERREKEEMALAFDQLRVHEEKMKHSDMVPNSTAPQDEAPVKARPTDKEIINTLALAYRVHESKVIEWLLDLDLSSARERLAERDSSI